jgi:hypothetical protein
MKLNYKTAIAAGLMIATPLAMAQAGTIATPQAGDPILDGGPPGPCDPGTANADYVGETDVNGHPVASANLDAAPVPVPGQLLVPLKSGQDHALGSNPAYVQADGKKLDALLNPPGACPVRAAKPRS